MKHQHSPVDVNIGVDIPTQDLENLITYITGAAIAVIGFYMAADTVRHILKSPFKGE